MSQLPSDPSRRTFLKSSSMLATGSLLVGFELPYSLASAPKSSGAASLMTDAFIRIDRDNTITVLMNHAEFGNGVYTSLAMMVAEELDIDWQRINRRGFYAHAHGRCENQGPATTGCRPTLAD